MTTAPRKTKIGRAALAALFLLFLIVPAGWARAEQEATAKSQCDWDAILACLTELISGASNFVASTVAKIVDFFIIITAAFMQLMIDVNSGVLHSAPVLTGFPIALNVANLGFVLAIIVIAFGTILRYESYQAKKTLVKLIAAALLVNFSMLIIGVFIDFSNVVSGFFFDRAAFTGNRADFSKDLAESLNVSKLNAPKAKGDGTENLRDLNTLDALTAEGFKFLLTLSASAILGFLIIVTFIAYAVMITVRYVALIVLIILMPLAWLFWVIPDLSGLTRKWWDNFMKWIFFLPAASFFLYLFVKSSADMKQFIANSLDKNDPAQAGELLLVIQNGMLTYLQILAMVGLLLGGLIAANKMGVMGASAALSIAERGMRKIGLAPVAAGRRAARAAGRGGVGVAKYAGTRGAKATTRGLSMALSSKALRWIPGAKAAANKLAAAGARRSEVEGYQKENLKNLTNKQFESYLQQLPAGPVAQSAVLAEAIERKMLAKAGPEILMKMADAARLTNPGTDEKDIKEIKDILSVRPDLAGKILVGEPKNPPQRRAGETPEQLAERTRAQKIKEATQKVPAGKASELTKEALGEVNVVVNLTSSAISNIYHEGNEEKISALNETLRKTVRPGMRDLPKNISQMRKEERDAKRSGDTGREEDAKAVLRQLYDDQRNFIAGMDETEKAAYDRLEHIEQRILNPDNT